MDIDSDSNGSTDDAAEESALVDNVIDTLLNAKNGDNSQIQFFTINSEVNSTWTNGCALPAGGVEAITLKKVIDDTRSKFLLGESKDIAGDFSNLLGEIVTSVLESTPLELPQKVNTTEEELNVWFDGQLQPQINESLDPSLWQGWRYVEETIGSETKYRIYFYDVDGENDNLLKAGVNVTVKYVPKESTS